MTIDTRGINELRPGKFRTSADDGEEQTCYFNRNKSDTHFTSFVAKRILNRQQITFSIVKVNSDFNLVNKSLDIELKKSLADGPVKRQFQQISRGDLSDGRSKTTVEPTVPRQRGGQCNRDDNDRRVRKKPRFLSAD